MFTGHHEALAEALGASAATVITNANLGFSSRGAKHAPRVLRDRARIEAATRIVAASCLEYDRESARPGLHNAAVRAGVDPVVVARVLIFSRRADGKAPNPGLVMPDPAPGRPRPEGHGVGEIVPSGCSPQ